MPQARRKTPFSGKAKKQQLQSKKQNKTLLLSSSPGSLSQDVVSVNYQPSRSGRGDKNRYTLKFYRENDAELKAKKEDALRALNPVPEEALEVDPRACYPADLDFPRRPPWNFDMTPEQLDAQEHKYFTEYVNALQNSPHWRQLSYCELNLETWRQLWRVLEMCDVLLLVVDARYAGMMFPPSLYEFVVKQQKKDMILVLNKADLVPAEAVVAWQRYFTETFPGLKVVYFTSCPGYNLNGKTSDKAGLQVRRRRGRQRMCAEGATRLLEACQQLVRGAVDLTPWEHKIKQETSAQVDYEEAEVGETIFQQPDTSFYQHERFKNGILTIGCVGQPNVGKSSLMNAIMGRKVVSVSKTPGHTKHFQTIFLTPNVRLCDCPGLVFPSLVERPVQILMGSYPIAQLREPYSTIRYLGERVDLPALLRIPHPDGDEAWSPRDVCDGWAQRRGYLTAKAARLDTYRAANSILRMALDGKICLWLRPPGFYDIRESIMCSEELRQVRWVQARAAKPAWTAKPARTAKTADSALTSTSSDSDDRTYTPTDGEESDTDSGDNIVISNKFAALGSDV